MAIKNKLPGILILPMGIALAILAYFIIDSTFLTAVGISLTISGITGIVLVKEIPKNSHTSSESSKVTTLHGRRSIFNMENILVISQALVLIGLDALLVWKNQDDISAFFVVNAIIFIITNWIYNTIKAKSKSELNKVSAFMITGCLIIFAFKFTEILR